MTTERRTNDFLVGASVILVTIVLIVAVLWVQQADLGGKTRHLTARTRDVGGVSVGNPVVIRGVRAGVVESIALGERGWVVLKLGIDRGISLPGDPVVLLVASSLFGEWQVTISDATGVPPDRELRAALVEAHTNGDTLAAAVLPDIAQLTSVAGRIAGDVAKVSDRVQVAFDDKAAKELRESIRNFAQTCSRDCAR
jgi:phospholipid/cholesterol/gamma-HCH transport system substrate-binding protein